MDAGNEKRKLRARSNTPSIQSKNDKENENQIEKTLKGSAKINTIQEESSQNAESSRSTETRTTETTSTTVTKRVLHGGHTSSIKSTESSMFQSPISILSSKINITKNALATSTPDERYTYSSSSRNIRRPLHGVAVSQLSESNQNDVNDVLEKTVGNSSSRSTIDANSFNENDHIAYKIYKAAGEYWKKYPKTDYTYSEVSPHRREIVPGVINMPNMSRSSLDGQYHRINYMINQKPEQESYIRSRYENVRNKRITETTYNETVSKTNNFAYDSQDEVDYQTELNYKVNGNGRKYTSAAAARVIEQESIFKRIFLSIITTFTTVTNWFMQTDGDLGRTRYAAATNYRYSRYHDVEKKGFFGRIASSIVNFFQRIYLLISSVLTVDTWALQFYSRRNKKGFILLLLVLLPLLLLAAWLLASPDPEMYSKISTAVTSILPLSILSFDEFLFNVRNKYNSINLPFLFSASSSSSQLNHNNNNLDYNNNNIDYNEILASLNIIITKQIDEKFADASRNENFINFLLTIINDDYNNNKLPKIHELIENAILLKTESLNAKITELNGYTASSQAKLQTFDGFVIKVNKNINILTEELINKNEANKNNLNKFILEIGERIAILDGGTDKKIGMLKTEILKIINDLNEANRLRHENGGFVTKIEMDKLLGDMRFGMENNMKDEIMKLITLMDESIKVKLHEIISDEGVIAGNGKIDVNSHDIRIIVKEMLAVYDADKTGLVDYALESAGGQVVSTRCTESYQTKTAQISIFGIPLWYPTNTPRTAISPSVQPGQCWAFQGFPGFLVLKLNSYIYVTGFTVEHIPKSLSPNGKIDSAPKKFTAWGLVNESDDDPHLFGTYEYLDNDASLQYFPVKNVPAEKLPYQIVELRVESNHGNSKYTCLYRFRVHGTSL